MSLPAVSPWSTLIQIATFTGIWRAAGHMSLKSRSSMVVGTVVARTSKPGGR